MKQIGQNSQGFSLKSYRRSKKDKHEPEPEPDFENSTSNTDDPSTNETMNTISAEERRQSPLLSGVAKVIEKQKKEEKKGKIENLRPKIQTKTTTRINQKKRRRKKKSNTIKITKTTTLGLHRRDKRETAVHILTKNSGTSLDRKGTS